MSNKPSARDISIIDALNQLGKLSAENGDTCKDFSPAHCTIGMGQYFRSRGISSYAGIMAELGDEEYAGPPGDCPCCYEPLADWYSDGYTDGFLTQCNNAECLLYHDTLASALNYTELKVLRKLDLVYKQANAGRWLTHKLKGLLLSWNMDYSARGAKERIRRMLRDYDNQIMEDGDEE